MPNKNGRKRIQKAALELFAAQGVKGTSTRDIARRAGLAEGTLYRHFTGKDDLAVSLFLDAAARLVERLERELGQAKKSTERLRRLVNGFFAYAAEEPCRWQYLMQTHPPLREIPQGFRLPKDVVVEVVRQGVEDGSFAVRNPVLGAAVVIGAISRAGFFLQERLLKGPVNLLAAETAEILLRALDAGRQ